MIDKGSVGAQLALGEGGAGGGVGKVLLRESFLRAGRHSVWLPAGVVKVPSLPASPSQFVWFLPRAALAEGDQQELR